MRAISLAPVVIGPNGNSRFMPSSAATVFISQLRKGRTTSAGDGWVLFRLDWNLEDANVPQSLGASEMVWIVEMKPSDVERFFNDLLSKPNRAEAVSWLDASTEEAPRTLGELETNKSSIDLVHEAYEAGAIEVIAVDIETYPDGSQNTGRLVVLLPHEEAARKKTLEWCNRQSERLGLPSEDEFGQKYTLVMLD